MCPHWAGTDLLQSQTTFQGPRIPERPVQFFQGTNRTYVNPCPGWPSQGQTGSTAAIPEGRQSSPCVRAWRGQVEDGAWKCRTGEFTGILGLPKVFTSQSPESVNMLPYLTKWLYRHDEVKDLGWKDYPGLAGWAQCNHKTSYKRGAGG